VRITVFQNGRPEEFEEKIRKLSGVSIVRSNGGEVVLEFYEETDPWEHRGAIGRALEDMEEEEIISSFR